MMARETPHRASACSDELKPAWMPDPIFDLVSDPRRGLVVVAIVACVFRLGSFLYFGPLFDMTGDVPGYIGPGIRLAEGLGYTRSAGPPAIARCPRLPLQIALSHWLTGDLYLAYLLNAVWGAMAVVAVYSLGRQAFGGTAVGVMAAILYAALPPPIFFQRLLMSVSLHPPVGLVLGV